MTATERFQYGVLDADGQLWLMPARMAEAVVAVLPECTAWRRLVHVAHPAPGVESETHGEWHPVDTAVTP